MAHLGFDLVNAVDLEIGTLTDRPGSRLRHHSGFRQSFGRGDFHREPGTEPVFIAPDASHLRAGVAWDQGEFLSDLCEMWD